jgi:hypothetical protein
MSRATTFTVLKKHPLLQSRWLRWAGIAIGLLLVAQLAMNWPRWQLRATVATGFGARMACSCRYVEGRDLKSCQSDFRGLEGMGLVRLSDDVEHKTVHASIPLMASRKAVFKDGFGCMPDKP